jgi:hypothetical protein
MIKRGHVNSTVAPTESRGKHEKKRALINSRKKEGIMYVFMSCIAGLEKFPLLIIPPAAPHSLSGAGTVSQIVANIPSGHNLTPPKETKEY